MDDKEMVFVKGDIVGIEPEKYLAYTTFDPNSGIEDVPDNYLTVTYQLTNNDIGTTLSVTQGLIPWRRVIKDTILLWVATVGILSYRPLRMW